jgi:hypothetical protein
MRIAAAGLLLPVMVNYTPKSLRSLPVNGLSDYFFVAETSFLHRTGRQAAALLVGWPPAPLPTPVLVSGSGPSYPRRGAYYMSHTSGLIELSTSTKDRNTRAQAKARSFSEAPLALLESSQRPQEIDSSKRWPIYVCEIELAEHTLP